MTAAAVVAVALGVGALLLTSALRGRLLDNLDTTLRSQAVDRAALLSNGADPGLLTDSLLSESVVWIGRPDGTTLASGGKLVVDGPPAGTTTGVRTVEVAVVEPGGEGEHGGETEKVRVATVATTLPDGSPALVSLGSELEVVDDPVGAMRSLLVLGLPALVLLVALLVWMAVSRALRPVDAIRHTAESIEGQGLDARVPVPDSDDEIERLARTLNEMLDRLHAHQEAQQRFVSDASHELKSPIANLRAELETIDLDDPAWPEIRARLVEQAERLTAIVDDLLVLAAQAERAEETPPEPVELDALVLDEAEETARLTPLAVDMYDVEPARVLARPDDLRRAVRNLLDNAARHAEHRIRVELHRANGHVELDISDDGPGVPPEARERIFDRFARLDDARGRDQGGTGLGLAIVKETVERHGGRVSVADADEGGAR
ncbi:MAG: sensor histidine kinase, partial [Actinomyces sp.]